ncbi:hypothetical protein C8Q80DRAFT_147961 [Daedaleopsis nitida]|nr:hypothetical protein C8Q80DRAFT_147961 [Daedaleopsis nitida]
MVKLALINAVAIASAVVQGAAVFEGASLNATLVERSCSDPALPHCETSAGSPYTSDCLKALQQLGNNHCKQTNSWAAGSHCQTVVQVGTCKIDVCGQHDAQTADNIFCAYYVGLIYRGCISGNRVGGHISPSSCNVNPETNNYRLQFSHS